MKPSILIGAAAVFGLAAFFLSKRGAVTMERDHDRATDSLASSRPKTAAAAAAASGSPSWGEQILGLAKDVGTQWVSARAASTNAQSLSTAALSPSSNLFKGVPW